MGAVRAHAEYDRGEYVQMYSVWASPGSFDEFCEAVSGRTDVTFADFQCGTYACRHHRMDMREECILNKLDGLLCGEHDAVNRLMVESSVLELISINLERLLCDGRKKNARGLSRTDVSSLERVRELLLDRLESPPSLHEISGLVHWNDCKLKRSFKQFFGKTIYEFVREQRLEKALGLLETGKCNVSEAAFAVGYTNIGHFSGAFQKKYGVQPRDVKKECRVIV